MEAPNGPPLFRTVLQARLVALGRSVSTEVHRLETMNSLLQAEHSRFGQLVRTACTEALADGKLGALRAAASRLSNLSSCVQALEDDDSFHMNSDAAVLLNGSNIDGEQSEFWGPNERSSLHKASSVLEDSIVEIGCQNPGQQQDQNEHTEAVVVPMLPPESWWHQPLQPPCELPSGEECYLPGQPKTSEELLPRRVPGPLLTPVQGVSAPNSQPLHGAVTSTNFQQHPAFDLGDSNDWSLPQSAMSLSLKPPGRMAVPGNHPSFQQGNTGHHSQGVAAFLQQTLQQTSHAQRSGLRPLSDTQAFLESSMLSARQNSRQTHRPRMSLWEAAEHQVKAGGQSVGVANSDGEPQGCSVCLTQLEPWPAWQKLDDHAQTVDNAKSPMKVEARDLGSWNQQEFTEDGSFGRRIVVSPTSSAQMCWEWFLLFLIFYDLIMAPLEFLQPPDTDLTSFMVWATRACWTINIPLSSVTGYMLETGQVEMRLSKALRNYAATWCGFDVLIIGFDWVNAAMEREGFPSVMRGLKILRVLRMKRASYLMRICRDTGVVHWLRETLYSEELALTMDILVIFPFIFVSLGHVLACCFYGLGVYQGIYHVDSQTVRLPWVQHYELGVMETTLALRYSLCMNWALGQFVGDVDFFAQTPAEFVFGGVVFTLVFVTSAAFVSRITASMTRLMILASRQATQFITLNRFLSHHRISSGLAIRVTHSAHSAVAVQKTSVSENDVELLELISEPLRVELHFEVYSQYLEKHAFFRCYNLWNPTAMRQLCHSAVSVLNFSRGDLLFTDGEAPLRPRMYFVMSGTLSYADGTDNESLLASTDSSSWICELALWFPWTHQGTLRATSNCELLALDAANLQRTARKFQMRQPLYPARYAKEIVRHMNEGGAGNDLGLLGNADVEKIVAGVFDSGSNPSPVASRGPPDRRGSVWDGGLASGVFGMGFLGGRRGPPTCSASLTLAA